MRTKLRLNEDILKRAERFSGLRDKSTLVHAGLHALIEKKASERIAALEQSKPRVRAGRKRRSAAR